MVRRYQVTLLAPSGKKQPVELVIAEDGLRLLSQEGKVRRATCTRALGPNSCDTRSMLTCPLHASAAAPMAQEINTFSYEAIRKWLPSNLRSKNPGTEDCLDLQIETDRGPRDLRMQTDSAATVKVIIRDLRGTTEVRMAAVFERIVTALLQTRRQGGAQAERGPVATAAGAACVRARQPSVCMHAPRASMHAPKRIKPSNSSACLCIYMPPAVKMHTSACCNAAAPLATASTRPLQRRLQALMQELELQEQEVWHSIELIFVDTSTHEWPRPQPACPNPRWGIGGGRSCSKGSLP